ETQRAIREDPASVIAWIARRFDVDQAVAAESYELLMPLLNESGEVPRDAVATFFRVQEDQPELRDTRYEDVVDTQPLQAVWQEMGRREPDTSQPRAQCGGYRPARMASCRVPSGPARRASLKRSPCSVACPMPGRPTTNTHLWTRPKYSGQ